MKWLKTLARLMRLLLVSMMLALGQVWANKMRSTLTTIGIVIGVLSVTVVIALLSGLRAKIMSDFETFGANKIILFPHLPRQGQSRRLSWRDVRFKPSDFDELLQHCPSIDQFTRMASAPVAVRYDDQTIDNDIYLAGIEPSWHSIEGRDIEIGRPFTMLENQQAKRICLITPEVRDQLNLNRECIGQSIYINNLRFTIVGVVEPQPTLFVAGGRQPPKEVFIPFGTAWRLYEPNISVSATSKSSDMSSEARAEARFYMRRMRRLKPDEPDTFQVFAMDDVIGIFNGIAMSVTFVAAGVVGISLLVGGVGIMNIMLVSVSERTREIGLRKAVGAKPSALLLQFLVEAVVLCLLGGLIGIVLAQGVIVGLSHALSQFLDQSYIPLWAVALAFGFCAGVGVVFGMFPAIKAAGLDPIEALRHE